MGAIIRTTSEDRQEKEIVQDVNYLVNLWTTILKRYEEADPGQKIYEDIPLALQVVRDHLDDDVESVITDSKDNQQEVYKFIKSMAPEYSHKVLYYDGQQDLFERHSINKQIQEALAQKVELKSDNGKPRETWGRKATGANVIQTMPASCRRFT